MTWPPGTANRRRDIQNAIRNLKPLSPKLGAPLREATTKAARPRMRDPCEARGRSREPPSLPASQLARRDGLLCCVPRPLFARPPHRERLAAHATGQVADPGRGDPAES